MTAASLRIARCSYGSIAVLLILAVAFAAPAVGQPPWSVAHEPDSRQASDARADAKVAVIVAPRAGSIAKASIKTGDTVDKGQILYELSDYRFESELENELSKLMFDLPWNESELDALTLGRAELLRSKSEADASFKEVDEKFAKYQQRVQILRQHKKALEQLRDSLALRSPIDGFVVAPRGPLEHQVIKAGSLIAIVTKEKPNEKTREKLREMLDVKVITIRKGQSLDP